MTQMGAGRGSFGGVVPEPKFSRKVFVGGLPPDSDADELNEFFGFFGRCWVDWPHKAESRNRFPPKGYAFIVYEAEMGVRRLLESCQTVAEEPGKLYIPLSSPSVSQKLVQVRPWVLSDAEYQVDPEATCDPRKTVFIGGVPRPLRAEELGQIFHAQFGGVCYAGIDTDADLRYPKGAGRVSFDNVQSYLAAISARYVFIQHPEASKRVEVKPYVLDDQMCDECVESGSPNPAPYFCPWVCCLQYYCHPCWLKVHRKGTGNRDQHKPLVKEPGLSAEFQKIGTTGATLGGLLRGQGGLAPPVPRRLPHVRPASISPVTGRPFRETRERPRSAIYPAPAYPVRRETRPLPQCRAVGEERGRLAGGGENRALYPRGHSPLRKEETPTRLAYTRFFARSPLGDHGNSHSMGSGLDGGEFSPFGDYLSGLGLSNSFQTDWSWFDQ